MTASEARRNIAQYAGAMLEGRLSFIEGARKIAGARFDAELESDPDVMAFVAMDSETDAFPTDATKALWQPEALAKLQPEIDKAEIWAKENLSDSCRRLMARFPIQE